MRWIALSFVSALLAACAAPQPTAEPQPEATAGSSVEATAEATAEAAVEERLGEPTVLLNMTSGPDDPHAMYMALELSGEALEDGRNVVLFFNVHAVPWAAKTGPSEMGFRGSPPLQQILRERMVAGATVLVCPHCMEVAEVTEAELIEGAQLATPQRLFAQLGPSTTVLTY